MKKEKMFDRVDINEIEQELEREVKYLLSINQDDLERELTTKLKPYIFNKNIRRWNKKDQINYRILRLESQIDTLKGQMMYVLNKMKKRTAGENTLTPSLKSSGN